MLLHPAGYSVACRGTLTQQLTAAVGRNAAPNQTAHRTSGDTWVLYAGGGSRARLPCQAVPARPASRGLALLKLLVCWPESHTLRRLALDISANQRVPLGLPWLRGLHKVVDARKPVTSAAELA